MTQMPLTLLIDLFLPFLVGWEVGVRQQRMWGNDSMTCSFLCFPLPPPPFSPFHHSIHPPPFFSGSSRRQRAPKMAALVPGGPQAALPSPIITGAMLGCLPHLHNAILTLSLPPSITGGVSPAACSVAPSPPDCVLCLSAQAQKIDSPLSLGLMFSR